MNRTNIEWVKNPDGTQGYTWNPITGCLNGCSYCYARKLANGRLKQRYLAGGTINCHVGEVIRNSLNPFYPRFWEEKLDIRRKYEYGDCRNHTKPRGIFACDMSDLFGIGIPRDWQFKIFQMIRANPSDRFYLLTKQPQNLAKFSPFPDNCWVGVSVTDNSMAEVAQDWLKSLEAKVKYMSIEPMLNQLNPRYLLGVDWLIIGAQTKPTVLPKIEWVQEIVEAADKAAVPVFLKNNLRPLLEKRGWQTNIFWADHRDERGFEPLHDDLRQEMPCP